MTTSIFLPGEAAYPGMTGFKNVSRAIKSSFEPVSEAVFDSDEAATISQLKTVANSDYLDKRPPSPAVNARMIGEIEVN